MASSLIGGLIQKKIVHPQSIHLFDPDINKCESLAQEMGINVASNNQTLVKLSDVIVIAVKPQVMKLVIEPISAELSEYRPLIISVAAGIESSSIVRWAEFDLPIVRVMPNTPALIGKGASGLYANEFVTTEQRALTEHLIDAVGVSRWVKSESDIDLVTALSGSGPAYFMLFIQSLVESAVKAGLEEEVAKALAVQTAIGASELVKHSELPLQQLIDNVTSPNGTTEQALKSFASENLKAIIDNAFTAAHKRSAELAEELG